MSSTIHVSGPGIDRRVTLHEGAGEMTVGRDAAADVHLPDPEKAISRKHLAIRLHGGAIEFRVVSSINGVTASKGEVPPGATGVLQAGEQITLGSYTLLAVAGGGVAPPADSTTMTSVTRTRTPGGDPLDVFSAFGSPRSAARSDDPFARPEFNPAPVPRTSGGADPFEALLGKPKAPPKPVGALPSAAAGVGGSAKGPDPMALLSGNQQQVVKQTGAGHINEWLAPGSSTGSPGGAGVLPPGFGGPARSDTRASAGPLSTDHVHDFNLPLKLPSAPGAAAHTAAAADPWAALQSQLDVPAAPGSAPQAPPLPIPPPPVGASLPPAMASVATPPARPPAPPVMDDDPFASLDQAFGDDPFSEWTSSATGSSASFAAALTPPAPPPPAVAAVRAEAGAAAPVPAQATNAAAAPAAAAGADGALVASLFAGLGLPVPKDFNAAGALHIGAMTRLIVEGFADLLAARAALKRELRAEDRTMLNARGNNPLKLGLTTDQLLQFLFASGSASAAAYMPPQRAMKETVTELRAHEIATIAASRAAVQGAIQDFEPVKLKAKLTKGKTKLPQFLDNARLWDMYQQHYEEQQQQMADWLDKLFDRHFMPVYSKESDRLRSAMEAADLSDPVPRPR